MASSFSARCLIGLVAVTGALLAPSFAHADERDPATWHPRDRLCCAFATHMPLHLGSSHIPITLDQTLSPLEVGPHSYTGRGRGREGDGILYTRRAGFIDLGHTRDYADLTAYLAVHLRPLLADGKGEIVIHPLHGERRVVVTKQVPPSLVAATSLLIARRAAFEISIWTEITQLCGRGKAYGAEEVYSAFTPEDLYSNLLGTYLGSRAVASARPYDEAMTSLLGAELVRMEAVSGAEAKRVLFALDGKWWHRDTPWPTEGIAFKRSFAMGPHLLPQRAPSSIIEAGDPIALDVPVSNDAGEPLSDFYRVELAPDPSELPYFKSGPVLVTSAELPAFVEKLRAGEETNPPRPRSGEDTRPILHFQRGLRLLELSASGGVGDDTIHRDTRGLGGGSATGVVGDTRGGDFAVVRFAAGATSERGMITGVSVFRTDAVYFCHEVESGKLRAPLVSLLGPCRPSEWFGLGGVVGEGFHDGRSGRTALRPIAAYGVLNVLGNGQAPSYDRARLLLRGGGAIEHVWSEAERGETIPRVGGGAIAFARSGSGRFEARGTLDYRIDPAHPEDAALESNTTFRAYFLLGAKESPGPIDALDPWGVASLGITSGLARFTRPLHAFPDSATPFVSAEARTSFQLLLTATLGFENLTF